MLESMKEIEELIDFIDEMPDPRMEGKVQYSLSTVVFITLCGILSGCESWIDIKNYGVMKESWLKKFVDLSNGIPSAWTSGQLHEIKKSDEGVAKFSLIMKNEVRLERFRRIYDIL